MMQTRSATIQISVVAMAVAIAGVLAPTEHAAGREHWVATWASAPQQPAPARGARPGGPATGTAAVPPATAPPATAPPATAPPATAPPATPALVGYNDQTLRMFMRISLGGRSVRLHLSNAFGTIPLVVGAAHVARHGEESAIVPGTDRALLFGGKPSVRIPPGASVVSDSVDLDLPALADLAISVYVPTETGPATRHSLALRIGYLASGDQTAAATMPGATTMTSWIFASAVDVLAPETAGTIVAFGDSITDGTTSTPGTNRSWPSVLAERMHADKALKQWSIVNLGISGNRILSDGAGVSALARFDRDVIGQAGVRWLMILEGINDINGSRAFPITADELISAMKQMIARAHTHEIRVAGCTLTPNGNGTAEAETMRTAVNDWIRKSGAFDAVVDFDAVERDPDAPTQFRKAFNNSDRLHPNDAGYKAMAESIDLRIFTKK